MDLTQVHPLFNPRFCLLILSLTQPIDDDITPYLVRLLIQTFQGPRVGPLKVDWQLKTSLVQRVVSTSQVKFPIWVFLPPRAHNLIGFYWLSVVLHKDGPPNTTWWDRGWRATKARRAPPPLVCYIGNLGKRNAAVDYTTPLGFLPC